jgi:hypothetical protein
MRYTLFRLVREFPYDEHEVIIFSGDKNNGR